MSGPYSYSGSGPGTIHDHARTGSSLGVEIEQITPALSLERESAPEASVDFLCSKFQSLMESLKN